MTGRYFYEDQEATTKRKHEPEKRDKGENIKQIATDEGFRIYSYDYYDFTFYNLQLWAAAKHRRIRRSRQVHGTSSPPNNIITAHWQNRM